MFKLEQVVQRVISDPSLISKEAANVKWWTGKFIRKEKYTTRYWKEVQDILLVMDEVLHE